jgi:hypothetical protein
MDILEEIVNIYQLRHLANREEIDYSFLLSALKDYTNPRQKICLWLKTGALIRVKKGLYVFGVEAAQRPYSTELLANLIYGPSAISLSYALAHHGLIPERVHTITSITNNRNKQFLTPIGLFTYQYLSDVRYQAGIELVSIGTAPPCLMATPEKALCDQVYFAAKSTKLSSVREMELFLLEDLRIDEILLTELSLPQIEGFSTLYKSPIVSLLTKYLTMRMS